MLEDDKIDVMSIRRAIEKLKITNPLVVCENGEKGLDYLNNSDNKRPCLILLDMNMPKMNGIEFLRIIKSHEQLKVLPVVVLTSSKEEQDKFESFGLGVAGYIIKPTDPQSFVDVLHVIDIYWTLSEQP
jgi:CheY-like chemotaxis protein